MTCQRCREEATVHLTETIDGRVRETHLCAKCASEAGQIPVPAAELKLAAAIQSLIVANVGELAGELGELACPICGLKYMDFRASGRLGCPYDYVAFDRGLAPLLGQSQAATRHVGKSPKHRERRPGAQLRLRAELQNAIANEDYEAAARLRDRLRHEEHSS